MISCDDQAWKEDVCGKKKSFSLRRLTLKIEKKNIDEEEDENAV